LKRQKSISSHAASISDWNTVFAWPSIVAALTVGLQLVARSSAALSRIAARSSNAHDDHSRRAAMAALMAIWTCFGSAMCQSASTCLCLNGITDCCVLPVRTSLPPMMSGISTRSVAIDASRALSSTRSGDPGA
jgi:hypothetical protein